MKKLTIISVIVFGFITGSIFADGAKTFKSKCGACHTLKVDGKKLTAGSLGPDLTGVATRQSEQFVKLYMTKPSKARKKFPKECAHLVKKCGKSGMKMPNVSLSKKQVDKIYKILK